MAAPFPHFHRGQPQDDDVVVVTQSGLDPSWSVLRHPGPAQISTTSRQEAIAIARSVATDWNVDLWSLDAGVYTLLKTYRTEDRLPSVDREAPAGPSQRRNGSMVVFRTIRQR